MALKCNMDPLLIERYLDGELGQSEALQVQQHIETCSICQARATTLRMSSELLNAHFERALQEADFSGFEQRVFQNLKEQKKISMRQKILLWLKESVEYHRAAWATAAACAVIIIIMALAGSWSSESPPPDSTNKPGQTAINPDKTQMARTDNDIIIDQLEYRGKKSMIFTVSKNNTTVIWMYDFDGPESENSKGDEI